MIHDPAAERETAVCGSTYRETVVYTSQGNSLQISIMATSTPDKPVHFLFRYQGEARAAPSVGVTHQGRHFRLGHVTQDTWYTVHAGQDAH